MNKPFILRLLITTAVIVVAVLLGHALWKHYLYSPWTRDGRVRAEIVQVAPDVSGLVSRVAVIDNQRVRKGDLLFTIDPARFANALEQARANLVAAEANARAAGANINSARVVAGPGERPAAARSGEAAAGETSGGVGRLEAERHAAGRLPRAGKPAALPG
ncbi:biotin/lipoyl-binding protein [Rhodanobacter lindaniclasticus]